MMHRLLFFLVAIVSVTQSGCEHAPTSSTVDELVLVSDDGVRLRLRAYGTAIVRAQYAESGEEFLPDDHYEMVQKHDWGTAFSVDERPQEITLSTKRLQLKISKPDLAIRYFIAGRNEPVLEQSAPPNLESTFKSVQFVPDEDEHFTGLGHSYYGRAESIDLRGQVINRNYGSVPIEQAPLIVPLVLSGKGYGLFLNSMFPNRFSLSANGEYSVGFDDLGNDGQMDIFFIAGPELTDVLDHYTALTGRPRLPMKSMFGLQLSDKGHDHTSETPSDVTWWKQKIKAHRAAGFPLDHVVNDNRWRAAGGKRCESRIEWDPQRYPDPGDYKKWLDDNGLVITLDFNRCIAQYSEGWQREFNLPEIDEIEFPDSAPDLTSEGFRRWFWKIFYDKALDPSLSWPGDALWIDEFDEQGAAPKDMVLASGRTSGEMRNYWFFLIAQALVADGWDQSGIKQRPFVWVRGMTAGAQRYATLWSGDIYPNYDDYATQVRAMQLAGLSGFPFWGHDAGGFYDWKSGKGPDADLYIRWAMAFGSFAPIWKPHGMGASRWPLDRTGPEQDAAKKFSELRYSLMPYTYSAVHQAATTGLPVARPMLLHYQHEKAAWTYDLQYLWGRDLLVAPVTNEIGESEVWLPAGEWYEFASGRQIPGDQVLRFNARVDELPIYVRAGAIIPRREFALSTAFLDKNHLRVDVYSGTDGEFLLTEDDDRSEAWKEKGEVRTTRIRYTKRDAEIIIGPAEGLYDGASDHRSYQIRLYGEERPVSVTLNSRSVDFIQDESFVLIEIPPVPVTHNIEIQFQY